MHTSDIIIIGAGIVGVSAAWRLAELGHSVTVLERGDVAAEASGVNAGMLGGYGWGHASHSGADLETHLNMGSLAIFQRMQIELGWEIDYRQCGTLEVIMTEAQHELAKQMVADAQTKGLALHLLSNDEARWVEPGLSPAILGAVYAPLRGQADPMRSTQSLAELARRAGADLRLHHWVTGLTPAGSGWHIATDRGDFASAALVLAAGAWCRPLGHLLGLEIPIFPVRGQMWATDPQPPRVHHLIASMESELHWHHERPLPPGTPRMLTHTVDGARLTRHLYGRQTRNGEIIFGGDRVLTHDRTVDPAGITANRGQAAEIMPVLAGLAIRRTWSGIMPFPLDGDPLLGRVPFFDNLFIAGGLRSSGFGRGPRAGTLVAELIDHGSLPILGQADPARLIRLIV